MYYPCMGDHEGRGDTNDAALKSRGDVSILNQWRMEIKMPSQHF